MYILAIVTVAACDSHGIILEAGQRCLPIFVRHIDFIIALAKANFSVGYNYNFQAL